MIKINQLKLFCFLQHAANATTAASNLLQMQQEAICDISPQEH